MFISRLLDPNFNTINLLGCFDQNSLPILPYFKYLLSNFCSIVESCILKLQNDDSLFITISNVKVYCRQAQTFENCVFSEQMIVTFMIIIIVIRW